MLLPILALLTSVEISNFHRLAVQVIRKICKIEQHLFLCNSIRWPFFSFTSHWTVLDNHFCALDTTFRTLITWYKFQVMIFILVLGVFVLLGIFSLSFNPEVVMSELYLFLVFGADQWIIFLGWTNSCCWYLLG